MSLLFFGIFDETVRNNPFNTAKVAKGGIQNLQEYGLPDSWQGGHAHKIVKLKGSKIMLIIDNKNETISVMVDARNLQYLKNEQLAELSFKYLHRKVSDALLLTRDEMISKLKDEGTDAIRLFKTQQPIVMPGGTVVVAEK